ncbi:protein unc-13 homolog 4B-like isoform X2 [Homarus americanus]|uniref:protein unc-13 homolog 4B-like isoform X2 n=1 Tax=Homarus americanus TaxID=6706 RepID=UPI001C455745|nr:protein unc-13 homolog 4B-like isoform X2 [Homarus americanus]
MDSLVAKTLENLTTFTSELAVQVTEALPGAEDDPAHLDEETEELLTDVLYCADTLMGEDGVWDVSSAPAGMAHCIPGRKFSHVSSRLVSVTMSQVIQSLQDTFNTDQETIERLKLKVQQRKPAALTLHLTVKEAMVHCRRSLKGSTNTYVTVTSPTGAVHTTRTIKGTLYPKWMDKFDLLLSDLQSDQLLLELWLEAERDDRRAQRIYRKFAHSSSSSPLLLGSLRLPVKEIGLSYLDGWYEVDDRVDEADQEYDSSKVYISGCISTITDIKNKQSHGALVKHVMDHVLHTGISKEPWTGRLPEGVAAVTAQHALLLSLSIATQQLIWWRIASQETGVDDTWALSQLKSVQSSLVMNLYSSEELLEFTSSLCQFQDKCTERIKNLDTLFPMSSGYSKLQLSSMLNALQSLQTHPRTRQLLGEAKRPSVTHQVIGAIELYAKNWWWKLSQETILKATSIDDQLAAVLSITEEVLVVLEDHSQYFDAIFMKEMNIRALTYIYQIVVSSLVECLQPALNKLHNNIIDPQSSENPDHIPHYDFGCGSSLWKVYKNLKRISTQDLGLPLVVKVKTGIDQYYQWFIPGVQSWIHFTNHLAREQVWEALQRDNFTPIDQHNSFSHSSLETTAIFHSLKVWWYKLAWPDPDSSVQFLQIMLENMYSLCIYYVGALCERADDMLEETSKGYLICQKVCVGAQNVEHIQKEMERLLEIIGFDSQVHKICQAGGSSLVSQIRASVDTLFLSKADDMKVKSQELRDTIIYKMKSTIEKCLDEACECGSSSQLLKEVLDPSLNILHNGLEDNKFQDYLWRFWKLILKIFCTKVANNSKCERAYYETLYKILQETFNFFTPQSGGLDHHKAKNEEYTSLLNHLEIMKMNTDALISHFYHERCNEQHEELLPKKGLLVIRTFFKDSDHLAVRVIMARDVVLNDQNPGNLPLEYFVKVQLHPKVCFPKSIKSSTRVIREDPATYDEEFEFDISTDGSNISEGVLVLMLMDKKKIHRDAVLGEAFVTLSSIAASSSDVNNMYLHMTLPSINHCYRSLQVLQNRLQDNTAHNFLKTISKHHPGLI